MASRADVRAPSRRDNVIISGSAAVTRYGALIADDDTTDMVYLPDRVHLQLDTRFAMMPDPLGTLTLRVVPDPDRDLAPTGSVRHTDRPHPTPVGTVALDLVDSPDPRHHIAARQRIADHV